MNDTIYFSYTEKGPAKAKINDIWNGVINSSTVTVKTKQSGPSLSFVMAFIDNMQPGDSITWVFEVVFSSTKYTSAVEVEITIPDVEETDTELEEELYV